MSNRDRGSLDDMLRAARKALEYTGGATRESLPSLPMRLDAVLYEIIVMGEAARRLSADIRAAHPEVPWREIIGMRSVITHGYDQIDGDELWRVIERDLPELIVRLESILAQEPPSEPSSGQRTA
jgi:uncharacterized protein with HEPN domain